MIVLDTNVISEPDKPTPDTRVLRWLNEQRETVLYLTAPAIIELAGGGYRVLLRTGSSKYLDRLRLIVDREFSGRILGLSLALPMPMVESAPNARRPAGPSGRSTP